MAQPIKGFRPLIPQGKHGGARHCTARVWSNFVKELSRNGWFDEKGKVAKRIARRAKHETIKAAKQAPYKFLKTPPRRLAEQYTG